MQLLSANFFSAIGKPMKGVFLSLTRQVIFLVPLILILPLFLGVTGIMYAAPVADTAGLRGVCPYDTQRVCHASLDGGGAGARGAGNRLILRNHIKLAAGGMGKTSCGQCCFSDSVQSGVSYASHFQSP